MNKPAFLGALRASVYIFLFCPVNGYNFGNQYLIVQSDLPAIKYAQKFYDIFLRQNRWIMGNLAF